MPTQTQNLQFSKSAVRIERMFSVDRSIAVDRSANGKSARAEKSKSTQGVTCRTQKQSVVQLSCRGIVVLEPPVFEVFSTGTFQQETQDDKFSATPSGT